MGKIHTGITVDEKFRAAVAAGGIGVSNQTTPERLREALKKFNEDITFEATNETVVTEVNAGVEPEPPVVEASVDFDISNDVDLFGKVASDLQTDVALDGEDITGTLKYVEGYTGFSDEVEEQSGNYLALHVDTNSEEDVYVEVVNGTSGQVKLDEDRVIVLRIADKDTQGVKVTIGDLIKEYTLDKLTVEEPSL